MVSGLLIVEIWKFFHRELTSLPWHLEVLSSLRWPKSETYKETRQTVLEWTNHFILKNRNNPKAKGLKHQPLLSPWHRCSNSENAIDFTFLSFVLYLHSAWSYPLVGIRADGPPLKSSVIKPPCLWRWQRDEPHHPSKAAMMVSEPPASLACSPPFIFSEKLKKKKNKIKLPWGNPSLQNNPCQSHFIHYLTFFLLYYFLICIFHILS